MSTASDHCRRLLAAIIPDRKDLLELALRKLVPDHFPDSTLRTIFILLERYYDQTGAILSRTALVDNLTAARADRGRIEFYAETFDALTTQVSDEPSFRWSLEQIRELAADRATGEILTEAMEILTRGTEDSRGNNFKGHKDARTHVMSRFAQIDRGLSMQESPEGDMRKERDEIFSEYTAQEQARRNKDCVGIQFGIPELDRKIGGLRNGELVLLVGYSSEGKSSLVIQLAWNAAVMQGRNVVILTTETVRSQVRRRTIARHSCLPCFNIPGGLNSRDIKNASLTPEQKLQFARVVQDFSTNTGYGRYYIVQVPRASDIGYIESKLVRTQQMFNIDLVIMDYLALLQSERRRMSDREELGSILKGAKQLAHTFRDGLGIPFVSPWQVSRLARQEAAKTGAYSSSALSETAEATNSPDLIISLLAPLDNEKRVAPVKMQVMKNRDGERANSIEVMVDYATSNFMAEQSREIPSTDFQFSL